MSIRYLEKKVKNVVEKYACFKSGMRSKCSVVNIIVETYEKSMDL